MGSLDSACAELANRAALSKMLSVAEARPLEALLKLSECLVREPRSAVVGITGPQGTGKSTLISRLVGELSSEGRTVAALLVDPSSPLTGGAVLGNRLRIRDLPDGAFVRSVWAEDERAVPLRALISLELLEAAGYDYVIVETPGAGQVNTSVLRISDLVVVVLMPLLGDEVQVIKAGLMEIGDVYVVNKADLPEADLMYSYVKPFARGRPVVKVSALYGENMEELLSAVRSVLERRSLEGARERKRIERRRYLLEEALLELLHSAIREELGRVGGEELLKRPEAFAELVRGLKARLANRITGGP